MPSTNTSDYDPRKDMFHPDYEPSLTGKHFLGMALILLIPAVVYGPKTQEEWEALAHYHSAAGHQERHDKAHVDALQARIAEQDARQAERHPPTNEPLDKGFVARHNQVKAWLGEANHKTASSTYQAFKTQHVGTVEMDHGVRIRYDHFSEGLYFICHPDVRRSESTVSYRSVEAEYLVTQAPGYVGHFVVWTDENDELRIKHAGGTTPPLTDEMRQSYCSRFSDRPNYELYRKYREEVMLPEMREHKEKRERELLERFQ